MAVFYGSGGTKGVGLDFLEMWKAETQLEPGTTTTDEIYYAEMWSVYEEYQYTFTGEFEYIVDPDTFELTSFTGIVTQFDYQWRTFYDDEELGSYRISGFGLDLINFDGSLTAGQIAALIFNGDDRIVGEGLGDSLFGYNGDDTIIGGRGNDDLDGGAGRDILLGEEGDDAYHVDNVRDVVWEYAGEGYDRVFSSVSYTLSNNVDVLTLTGSKALNGTGNALNNTLVGTSAANVLDGRAGADRMFGGLGNDTFVVEDARDVVTEKANEGTDIVNALISYALVANVENLVLKTASDLNGTGNALNNVIAGNSGRNTLSGAAGNDTLKGGGGNDKLIGGLGADKLYGGSGADMFVLKSYKDSLVISRDTIYDFSRTEKDKIDLSEIDARSTIAGNQAFTFVGTKEFSEKAGELRYLKKGGDTFLYGDLNGDAGIDFSIRLDGTIDLKASDFIL
ncbi:calcium-binding protein [Sinorhizobium sp. RAC02]|uniref:calcium-binding protein n=1 Tax=Sinorhizobium sp. RAC02 TaxID=1842534 RepID=UPI0008570F46|nr:calcium-binding protein [Sinorhizobium sp. RAC02]AOF89884.1 hemolysin-type calcium-binding repeat family protein [Sinorhizobium sp. RAC02]